MTGHAAGPPELEVLRSGALATVQDLGRPGLAHLGVGGSGAADRPSLRLANRLVGNPESAACVEATLGGLALRFSAPARVACTGAPCAVRVDGRAADMYTPLSVPAAGVLDLSVPAAGLRTYVAVAGGIDVPPVLGARATDTLARLGPAPLAPGARLRIGTRRGAPGPDGEEAGWPVVGETLDVAPQRAYPGEATLRVLPGPRDDWFVADAVATLCSAPYRVTPECDRIGMRLAGPGLVRSVERELPSEGTVPGALQVPPDGQPILFLADHPVTGGYPVIAVVAQDDLHLAAQMRPGGRLAFRVRR